ncbi:hypothetical protein C0580_03960 [Candidatus Parcubacteria bacterium]|nr:MAG: hypothetical protein C0580_03960 [Candidatus Parcubacteria bacterium]
MTSTDILGLINFVALFGSPVTLKEVKQKMKQLSSDQQAAINWAAQQLLGREIIYAPDIDEVILSAFDDIPLPPNVDDKVLARLRALKRERQLVRH